MPQPKVINTSPLPLIHNSWMRCTHMIALARKRRRTNKRGRRSRTEILMCALYARARSGLGFKRSRDEAGREREERGGGGAAGCCLKQSTAGYCTGVVGKPRTGVPWHARELALEPSHQRRSAPPSSASSQLIKLALFFPLSAETQANIKAARIRRSSER